MVDSDEVVTVESSAEILEMTKETAMACGELARCATEIHGELLPKGEQRGHELEEWSQGLLAAVRRTD